MVLRHETQTEPCCGSLSCVSAGFTATLADNTEAADTAAGEVQQQQQQQLLLPLVA